MLAAITTGDTVAAWVAVGFSDPVRIGPLVVECDAAGDGVRGWTLVGTGPAEVDGVPTRWVPEAGEDRGDLDHVVVLTDSLDRTVRALVAVGGDERRRAAPMAFVRMGRVIVEVVERDGAGGGGIIWGLVAVVDDLGSLPADLVGTPKDAVQPGRRIVTARAVPGLQTALAFMTPRVRAG